MAQKDFEVEFAEICRNTVQKITIVHVKKSRSEFKGVAKHTSRTNLIISPSSSWNSIG